MQPDFDYRQFAILYVDDEEKSLKLFTRAFGETFRIFTAANAKTGLQILEENKRQIGVLMTDQRMPGERGVWLLERARQIQPGIIRVLVTAYTDMEAAIEAVNSGAISRYVHKPWDPLQLEHTLKQGLEFFAVQRERDQLLREKMSVLHNMMVADRVVSLGNLAAGLSHHIRNALVSVKTFLDLAPVKMEQEKAERDRVCNPEFWNDYYQNVQGQIQKILGMLTELGSASENPCFDFRDEVCLPELVGIVVHELEGSLAARSIRIANNIPESVPTLKGDRKKLLRLFELLLKDEIVSLPEGSTVTFSARSMPESGGCRGEIEVRVQDDGPGLPKEALRGLFDPFVVRNGSPMLYGINLMECYFIVHYHGGRMEAESVDGRGTTFMFRLPLNPDCPPATSENPDFLQKVVLNQVLWEKLSSE
jgi:two-component system probable response regulator PhcQ